MRASPVVPATLLVLASLSGCASPDGPAAAHDEVAGTDLEARTRMCTDIYRDARVACREGLQKERASQSFECMSARMKLDRHCGVPQ